MKRDWSESMSSSQKKVHVTELLLQGRELANQLHMALKWPALNKDEVRGLAEGLAVRIFESFMNSVLILNGIHGANEVLDSQIQANTTTVPTVVDASSWGAHGDFVKSETRHESCKITETVKDRRGSYKRRKTTHSWTKDSHAWVDDGHVWRKYGQKTILDTRHPRNYFRCSHKFEQGCKATKQVQQIQDTPKLFRTTYYDNHTCTDYLKAPDLFMDCSRPRESSSNMIRFDNTENDLETEHEHPFFSSFTTIKRETIKEEDMISPISEDHPGQNKSSLLSDCLPPTDPTSTIELDYDDMIFRLMEGHFDDLKFLI